MGVVDGHPPLLSQQPLRLVVVVVVAVVVAIRGAGVIPRQGGCILSPLALVLVLALVLMAPLERPGSIYLYPP